MISELMEDPTHNLRSSVSKLTILIIFWDLAYLAFNLLKIKSIFTLESRSKLKKLLEKIPQVKTK